MGELLVEKVAIVTGGASGLGRATVELFAQHGAKVVIADVNDERGAETVKAVEAQGGEATYLHTDVAVSADVRAVTPEQRAAIPHSQPRQRFGEAIFPVCEPTEVAQVHLFLNSSLASFVSGQILSADVGGFDTMMAWAFPRAVTATDD